VAPAGLLDDAGGVASAILVVLGVLIRARGVLFGTIPLWEDEAAWAMRLMDLPLREHTIRPLGFMAASKLLASAFSPSEMVLRLLPWLAGSACVWMAPSLAKYLFSSTRARLLFVATIALHPAAIDLAREFKPYAVSLAIHMSLLSFALRYLRDGDVRVLSLVLAEAFVSTLFAQDALFAFPSLFGVLLFEAFRKRRSRHLWGIASAALATMALVVGLYALFWRVEVHDGERTVNYWGSKYDVFFVPSEGRTTSRLAWTAGKVAEVAALPGLARDGWSAPSLQKQTLLELERIDAHVWEALSLVGLAALLARRRRIEALLLIGPIAVMVLLNSFGYWPLGAFRTNLFLLVYGAGLAISATDARDVHTRWSILPAAGLIVVPFILFANATVTRKGTMAANSSFTLALRTLQRMRSEVETRPIKPVLALDNASCAIWRYYSGYHPRRAHWNSVGAGFSVQCTKSPRSMAQLLRRGLASADSRSFALLSSAKWMGSVKSELSPKVEIEREANLGSGDQLVFAAKSAQWRK
jgi:hypothetical protein